MSGIDDLLERTLQAEGAAASPAPDAWERLRDRLDDDTTPAGRSPASRGWPLVVAAAVAGFGGLATAYFALSDDGSGGGIRTASPPADETGTSLSPVPESPNGTPAPAAVLAVSADGELVRIDAGTGAVEPLPGTPEADADEGEITDNAAAGLDGMVLFSTCCEPAPGHTYRLEDDGSRTFLAVGYNPVLAPDGTRFSLVQPTGVTLHDLDGNVVHTIDAGEHLGSVMAVAWSPADDRLAVEVGVGAIERRIILVDADADSLAGGTEIRAPDGLWWTRPVFRSDGSLLVAEHPLGQFEEDAGEGSAVRMVSPDGQPGETIGLDGAAPLRLAADRAGEWVAVSSPDGRVFLVDSGGAVWPVPATGGPPHHDLAL